MIPAGALPQIVDTPVKGRPKHFYVYTVAGAAKFLRIYYARAKEYLLALEAERQTAA